MDPAEFLGLDAEQQADLLLAGLGNCRENECGRNFLIFQLHEWFPEGIYGSVVRQSGARASVRREDAETLDDAYARLERQGFIRANPRAGTTFCKLTDEGRAHLEAPMQPDAARVAFATGCWKRSCSILPRTRQVGAHFRQGKFETALRDGSTFLEDSIET